MATNLLTREEARRALPVVAAVLCSLLTSCAAVRQHFGVGRVLAPGSIQGEALLPRGPYAERRSVVVFATPLDGSRCISADGSVAHVRRVADGFEPSLLVVASGQEVRFQNGDRISHRFFSSGEEAFDLGSLKAGESATTRFHCVGPVRYYCSLHEGEGGLVYVAPTPYFALAGADGKFEIRDLPAGPYRLESWAENVEPRRQFVSVHSGRNSSVEIDFAAPPRVP